MLRHAQALLRSAPGGVTTYIEADLRDPQPILRALHLVSDAEDPWGTVTALMDAVPPGSYLVISHAALDISEAQAEGQRVYNQNVSTAQTLRTRDEVARFFTGLEFVPPGLVQVHQWHPDPEDDAPAGHRLRAWRRGAEGQLNDRCHPDRDEHSGQLDTELGDVTGRRVGREPAPVLLIQAGEIGRVS